MVSAAITARRIWMRRAIAVLWWAMAALSAPAAAAEIVATVDRNVVRINESLRLTFEADGDTGEPDFSPLRKDFEILDQSSSQNLSIVNGRTSRTYVWELVLMATKPGRFQIPPIEFGSDSSQRIDITVQQGSAAIEDKPILLDVEVDVEQPYVQQQVVFTIRLSRAVEVSSASLSELTVEGVDAIVERLGEDRSFQMVRSGRRWLIVERKYVVFPQQSGHMTIPPLQFKGQVVTRRSNSAFSIFNQAVGRPVVLRSASVTLPVREPPASLAGNWLPAKHIELQESWPQKSEIKVGEPITRSLSMRAEGLSAAQLPEFGTALPDGLRAYPEGAKLENTATDSGLMGTRIETMAMIPTEAGTVTLPEIQLAWWNVDKQQPEIATLPARTFEAIENAPVQPAPRPAVPVPEKDALTVAVADGEGAVEAAADAAAAAWWPWLSLSFGIAWVLTLALWLYDRSVRRRAPSADDRDERADPRRALKDLRSACQSNQAELARDALLEWGTALWPEVPPRSLGQLAGRCVEPLCGHIRALEQVLYANKGTWDSNALLDEAARFKPAVDTGKKKQRSLVLEPLYRV